MQRGTSPQKHKIIDTALLIALVVLPLLTIFTIIHFAGPQWDTSVRYLSGKTLVDFLTHNISPQIAFSGEFSNNLLYYFEPYREPLSTPIFALLYALFQKSSVFVYIVLIYFVYLLVLYKFSKELKLSKLVTFSILINSYAIYFFFIPNGGEGLSIIFVLIGLLCLLKKKPVSGLFFGIASIAKYPTIILIPLVLLLDGKRKKIEGIVLAFIPMVVWGGMIDYGLYKVPFLSYFESVGGASIVSGFSTVSLISVLEVVAFPLAVIAAITIFLLVKREKFRLKFDYTSKVLACFLVLAGLCYALILPHNDPITQARYGYLFATALLVLAAFVMDYAVKRPKGELIKYSIVIAAIAILGCVLYMTYTTNNNPSVVYYNYNNANSIYVHAGSELGSLGYGGCRFISNVWIPMLYSGYNAYSPLTVYYGKLVVSTLAKVHNTTGTNVTNYEIESYNQTVLQQLRYPIVAFKYDGVPLSFIDNLNQSSIAYNDNNISIYLPQNVTCYKD